MAIDIRATSWVLIFNDKYPLVTASISDSYMQGGVGIVTTTGTCTVQGTVAIAKGRQISIQYTLADGITRTLPRVLLCFSSFPDPLRGTTQIDLGCPFAYGREFGSKSVIKPKEPTEYGARDASGQLVSRDPELRLGVVEAGEVAATCLAALKMDPRNPLKSKFFIDEFDLSPGVFQILSDLLISEGFIIYAESKSTFKRVNTSANSGGVVLGADKIIDISSIGMGAVPGASVNTTFNAIVVDADEQAELICETDDPEEPPIRDRLFDIETLSTVNRGSIVIPYERQNGSQGTAVFKTLESTYEETQYQYLIVDPEKRVGELVTEFNDTFTSVTPLGPKEKRESIRVLTQRKYAEEKSSVTILGSWVTAALSAGIQVGSYQVPSTTIEKYLYDGLGREIERTLERRGGGEYGLGPLGIPMSFTEGETTSMVGIPGGEIFLEGTTVRTYYYGNTVKTITKRYGPWTSTIAGQQAIAEARDTFDTVGEANAFIASSVGGGKFLLDVTTSISRAPEQEEETAGSDKDIVLANIINGPKKPERDTLGTLGGGGGGADTITFNLPYAPDDIVIAVPQVGTNPTLYCYLITKAEPSAVEVARAYGALQNRLLSGNRYGCNIVTSPMFFSPRPGQPFSVRLKGFAGSYLANGTTWTINSDGVVVSTDGLAQGNLGAFLS